MSTKSYRKAGGGKRAGKSAKSPKKVSGKTAAYKKAGKKKKAVEREEGPLGWLIPTLEASYTRLIPRADYEAAQAGAARKAAGKKTGAKKSGARKAGAKRAGAAAPAAFESTLQPGEDESVLADVAENHWVDRLAEYKRRKAASALGVGGAEAAVALGAARAGAAPLPPGPVVPGQKNWGPLGPSVVMEGQAHGLPAVGGRVSGIAIAPGGQLIYAATANGGVFRSEDAAVSWRSLMDAFDVDPTSFASTSLACGAIAIDRNDPNRIYVGTGEGDTHGMFQQRIINALPAYRGIGPIRSDDGGQNWVEEPTAAGSPTLAGKAFFALAVDPANRESVVGATTDGLYQRTLSTGGAPRWTRRRAGIFSSVVVASSGGTKRFFAAEWGRGVVRSSDGSSWSALGAGFPLTNVGRIALAVQPNNPNLVYAFVADASGASRGVFRLSGVTGSWKQVTGVPSVLPSSQGDYDLAITIDPADADLIYLGGSYFHDNQFWPASVWRCRVRASGSGFAMTGTSIGKHAHADVHVLMHSPNDPNALWVGCDGGVFLNRDPRGTGIFASRNNGLSSLCTNFFAQHPTDPNIIFCGLQDNGTARTGGGPIWRHVNWGDGGYCLINWADPRQVLVFANGTIYRATDGGLSHDSWTGTDFPWATMTEPITGPPFNPSKPAEAKLVALGAGLKVRLSKDFGASWATADSVSLPGADPAGSIFALSFASATRFYVGTTAGDVFRVDKSGTAWTAARIDNASAGPLPLRGIISDIAVDWADPSLNSLYVAFGGMGDYRHVWRYNGTRWQARSGPATGSTNLLDVEHNAITVDKAAPANVYVGADIGVWHSPDGGQNWTTLPNGLPDAPVFDLQTHPTRRLLRAATHGRGIYEYPLDPAS